MDYKPYSLDLRFYAKSLNNAPDEEILDAYWSAVKMEEEHRRDMADKVYPRGGKRGLQNAIEHCVSRKMMYLTTLLLRGRTDLLEQIDSRSEVMC